VFADRRLTQTYSLLFSALMIWTVTGPAFGLTNERASLPGSISTTAGQTSSEEVPAVSDLSLERPHPPKVFEEREVSIVGTLTATSEGGLAGKRIVLDRRADGARWSPWLRTKTDAVGGFSFTVALRQPRTIELRARHVVNGETVETSNLQTLTVLNRSLSLHARQRYVTFGDVAMSGETRPAVASARIVLQRLRDGRWRKLGATTTRADGSYGYRMPNRQPGKWRVRALWNGARPGGGTREVSVARRYEVRVVLAPEVERVTTKELGATWHAGCPVGASSLRNVSLTFRKYNGVVKRGVLVVHSSIVSEVISVWRMALRTGYPFRSLISVAEFGGSDPRSMWHDNTSAFNCRAVTGDPYSLSPHSYGTAIDINTVRNPYQDSSGRWWPHRKGASYRNRSNARPGMLFGASRVTSQLRRFGFQWGGYWSHPDYQHFDPAFSSRLAPSATPDNAAEAPATVRQPSGPAPTKAGPLSRADVPDPTLLGKGWQRYVEPGGTEEGWLGNGTSVRARDPHEAANGALPLGCADRPGLVLPVPTHALQGSYRSVATDDPARVVVLQFSSSREARGYFVGLTTLLDGCDEADGPAGLVVRKLATQPTYNLGDRHYGNAGRWSEVDVLAGDRVAVLLSSRPIGDERAAVRALRAAALE